jgi:hypothetical protein
MMAIPRFTGVLGLLLLLIACSGEKSDERRQLGSADHCDAALSSCRVSDGDIHVTLTMGPGVKPLQPFTFTLVIEGGEVAAQSVVADFQMQDMDMGSNRYRLQPQQEGWQATVILPVCSVSRMDWLAIVDFTLDGEPLQAVFPFHTN